MTAGPGSQTRASLAAIRRRMRMAAFDAVRVPAAGILRGVRSIPLVRRRLIPWLVREELGAIPSAGPIGDVRFELKALQESSEPILIGPWLSEVGFELLYWIPFLNWAAAEYELDPKRFVVVSRGGTGRWYGPLGCRYVDVFSLFSLEEFRSRSEVRWRSEGGQKQFAMGAFDREVIDRVRQRLRLHTCRVLHPSLMYNLFIHYWLGVAPVSLFTGHSRFTRIPDPGPPPAAISLPDDYIAVRFYFSPSFPDTPANRAFVDLTKRALAAEGPVVDLDPGMRFDDHEAGGGTGGESGVHRLDHGVTPEHNLEVQTQVLHRARAFVGTYGGLAYLGPLLGVTSVGVYSDKTKIAPSHLDASERLATAMDTPLVALDVRSAPLVRRLAAGERP